MGVRIASGYSVSHVWLVGFVGESQVAYVLLLSLFCPHLPPADPLLKRGRTTSIA